MARWQSCRQHLRWPRDSASADFELVSRADILTLQRPVFHGLRLDEGELVQLWRELQSSGVATNPGVGSWLHQHVHGSNYACFFVQERGLGCKEMIWYVMFVCVGYHSRVV